MKKLLILFIMVTVAVMTECTIVDRSCHWYYMIDNQTGADIVVEVGHGETVYQTRLIESYYIRTIYDCGGPCKEDEDADPVRTNPEAPITYDVITYMKINGELMSDAILKRKYWTFFYGKRGLYSCTMTLTNELLEEFRQQEEL